MSFESANLLFVTCDGKCPLTEKKIAVFNEIE